MTIYFNDLDFQLAAVATLNASYRQAADASEVLVTAGRIADGDPDSWLHEWTASAGAVWSHAVRAQNEGHLETALAHFRRAATYYATALSQVFRSSEPERQPSLWRRQRACWDAIVRLSASPAQQLAIPYDDTALPGFFFPAPGAAGERRPLVIINGGYYQPTSETWVQAGAAAAERGYHWMTFDGPGQEETLVDLKLAFRPDWEAVLTAVLNNMVERTDVQPNRIAVIGVGQGSYFVARALAFEHRFAAGVVDPGVIDVSSRWTDRLPKGVRDHLREQRSREFDHEIQLSELFTPETSRLRGEPFGHHHGSPYELYRTVGQYQIEAEIQRIKTPLLIIESDTEQIWPGQSRRLYDALRCPKKILSTSDPEGVRGLADMPVPAQRESLIFDWLDGQLHDRPATNPDTEPQQPAAEAVADQA